MRAVPGLHVGGHGGVKLVADNVERDLAGGARRDRNRHRLARRVFGLVERDFQQVRRVGGGIRVEAGVERHRRRRNAAVIARDIEAVAAPGHGERDAARLVGGYIDAAVGQALRALDRLVLPAAVAAVILVAPLDLEQFVAQAGCGKLLAVRRSHDDIEAGVLSFAERLAGEQRLHADHRRGRRDRERQVALDRASAGLDQPHRDLRLKRTRGRRHLVERDGELRLAVVVGLGQVFERGLLALHRVLVVIDAELVAGEARTRVRRLDLHLAFEIEI